MTRPERAKDLVAITKPGITIANLLVTGAGVLAAEAPFEALPVVAALVGTAAVVASANAWNMVLERDADALMARTRSRPLAAGRLAPRTAIVVASALGLGGTLVLGLGANLLTATLGLAALVAYAFIYTPMKRRSPFALHVGAFAGAVPPLLGVTALTPGAPEPGLWLALAVWVWQFPHFLAIAQRRRDDYAAAGIRAWSVVHGEDSTRRLARVTAIALVPVSLAPALAGVTALWTALALALLGAWLAWSAWSPRDWARLTFLASLAYLPAVPLVLGLDRIAR